MSGTGQDGYGRYYWCIQTPLSQTGEVFVYADESHIHPDGTLTLSQDSDDAVPVVNLAFAPANWISCFRADPANGKPLAIAHWNGLVVR
jgi:hypothetical protein